MRRQIDKSDKEGFVFWLRKNKALWLKWILVLAVMAVYVYHWSSVQTPIPEDAEMITIENFQVDDVSSVASETEIAILDAQDNLQILTQMIKLQTTDDVEISDVPDIQQVMHTSRLRRILPKIAYEEKLPQNVIPHKKKNVVTRKKENKDIRVAIVIDDMGGSPMRTREITSLEAPLTSSFLTFADDLKRQIKQAQTAGHEIMVHVPMQPQSDIYVSKDVLKVDMSEEQILQTLSEMLDKFDSVRGINNHMGSRFTESYDKLIPVMKLLAEKKLFFLDSKTTAKSQAENAAEQYNVPYLHRHVFLDNNNDFDYIMQQLELTERIAKRNGYAIAIGHPKSQTAKALRVWLGTLKDKNIHLVPLSELIGNS